MIPSNDPIWGTLPANMVLQFSPISTHTNTANSGSITHNGFHHAGVSGEVHETPFIIHQPFYIDDPPNSGSITHNGFHHAGVSGEVHDSPFIIYQPSNIDDPLSHPYILTINVSYIGVLHIMGFITQECLERYMTLLSYPYIVTLSYR